VSDDGSAVGLPRTFRRCFRAARPLLPWLLTTATLVTLFGLLFEFDLVEPGHQPFVLNLVSLAGIVLLAVPAIRVNEQGRLIERVRTLQTGIEADEEFLRRQDRLSPAVRKRQEKTLKERQSALADTLKELISGKGAWTPVVHRTLYLGYVLLLGASVARVLF